VPTGYLGRTNRSFPSIWLSLSQPNSAEDLQTLAHKALDSGLPIDISSGPAIWGGQMRGTDAPLMVASNSDYERANNESHACDLVQAHLIEVLSSLGRDSIDFYFVRVRRMVEEFQISGVLQALEIAKNEGHVGYIGLMCDGPSLATLGFWQFHDAFEVLSMPRNHYSDEAYRTLSPLAKERRVGVITTKPLNWGYGLPFIAIPDLWRLRNLTQSFYGMSLAQAALADLSQDHPVVVSVNSSKQIDQAIQAQSVTLPDGLDAMLEPFRSAFDDEELWKSWLTSDDVLLRNAAQRRFA